MKTEDFNHGDKVLVRLTDYVSEGFDTNIKPEKVVSILEMTISVNKRGKREVICEKKRGRAVLKNFKKGVEVRGSFGMILYKSSWLNISLEVLGGLDAIRNYKLESIMI